MNNETLLKDIEKLRKRMIAVGESQGLASEETIKLSKKLDILINLQMRNRGKISA
ncbi:aspartyl-phosphate phosphatase Spo0E family protein [Bacillus sp. EB600]|uniref:aspartyl-phosphate phosphatase Spo0E family protein n=1 Tax=Bacillus sp. EB600 TaxID=2806345 RepID=UPI00210A0F14|nr:aspartyl-phosphate phosphatase Spo0E family protein [Bacillus sp. EB600]MCQ6280485.1 aspartyl-phosphate phosphatase Spo0E family protein [Bacillus sp. EB600]